MGVADKVGVWLGKKIGTAAVSTSKTMRKAKSGTTKFTKGWKRVFRWNRTR